MAIGRSRREEQQDRWKQSARYWKALPPRSTILFLAAVFCLFACFGFISAIFDARHASSFSAAVWALNSGTFAVLWAFSGPRRHIKLMIGTGLAQFTVNAVLPTLLEKRLSHAARFTIDPGLQRILVIDAAMTFVLIILGYIFFISFTAGEGKRTYAAFTELRLANEIHRSLVPPIGRKFAHFEIAAFSAPSGEMGGDLVDVVENHDGWLAYLADVSGHGVSAGVVMSMVKSAVRMGVQKDAPVDLGRLLASVNSVLTPLSSSSTFVTFACVAANGGANVAYTLAGHLPLLHYRRSSRTVEENSIVNFPLAIFGDASFTCGQLQCDAGDVLALLTDGLTETADKNGDELGLVPLKEVLADNSERPLGEILTAMRDRSLAFGKQTDDQSILLIRRTE